MRLVHIHKAIWSIGLIFGLGGCATSHTSAEKVSMWDLWSGNRLQEHLIERRMVLDTLFARAAKLATEISRKTEELGVLERDLNAINAQSVAGDTALQRTREEIQVRTIELSEMRQNITALHEQIAQLERNLQAGHPAPNSNADIQKHREEIGRLENEVALLSRSIDRILLVRAKHGLQTK